MNGVFEQMVSRYEIKTANDRIHATREVIQEIALSALYRGGLFNKAAFYGGTCLRIFHELPRFSEDMDFSLLEKNPSFSIDPYLPVIEEEFKSYGRDVEIKRKKKKENSDIESAFLKDNTEIASISFQTEPAIKIKIEIDKNPPLNFRTENKLLLLPYSFMARCFDIPGLYAGKLHAFLFRGWKNRVKGRDWFDLEWYVKNNYKVDFQHLKARALQFGYTGTAEFTRDLATNLIKERIISTNINRVIEDVRPFVRNPEDLDIWSLDYFLQIAEKIAFHDFPISR